VLQVSPTPFVSDDRGKTDLFTHSRWVIGIMIFFEF
jgi:hypothetical protein